METSDAIVVGGGPAGLAGALYLARFRRSVVVVDAGDSRAARIPRSHNVAGFAGGITGPALLDVMRRQAADVGVRLVDGTVDAIAPDGEGFVVRGSGGLAIGGMTVLLATGATDVEPAMADIPRAVADGSLRYCPVCDGYEVAGCHVGVLCDSAAGLREAVYLHHFTPRVSVFFTAAMPALAEADRAPLLARGIVLCDEAPAADIHLADGGVRVRHGERWTRCDSLYSALGMRVHSGLAEALGVELDPDGYVVTDRHQESRVTGIFSAGDVARGLNQISVGIGAAAIAASAMHLRLNSLKQPPAPACASPRR